MKKYNINIYTVVIIFAIVILIEGIILIQTQNKEFFVEDSKYIQIMSSVGTKEYEDSVNKYKEEIQKEKPIINADSYRCSFNEIYYTSPTRIYTEEEKELIAKMLYCEAGSTSWDCQVANCSAIINLIEYNDGNVYILDDVNAFSPAYMYRDITPMETQYDVLNYVLSGHLIADIKYFRTDYYHPFGTPMFAIDNVYYSK